MSYSVKLDRFLSESDRQQLTALHMPSLLILNARYTPTFDPARRFPVSPIYVDCLRCSWMLDESDDRPTVEVAVSGLGLAFGILLGACTGLRWAIAQDNAEGVFMTMARETESLELVSVPPFDYMQKRQELQSAEVVQDFFKHVPAEVIGFRRPRNWMLDGEV